MKRNYFRILMKTVSRGGKGLVVAAIGLKVVSGIMPILYIQAYSYFIEQLLQRYSNGLSAQKMTVIVLSFIGVGILNYFNSGILSYVTQKLRYRMEKAVCLDNISKIAKLEYGHMENSTSYDSVNRVRKGTPNMFLEGFFAYLGIGELVLKLFSVTGAILVFSPWMSVLMLTCCIPVGWVSLRSGKEDYQAFVEYQKIERRMDYYETILTGKNYLQESKVYGYGEWILKRWDKKYQEATDIFLRVKKKMYLQVKVSSGIVLLSFLAMIGGLAYETVLGAVPLGTFTSVTNELLTMSGTVSWTLSALIHSISKCHAFLQDYDNFLGLSELKENALQLVENKETVDCIEFQNVSFCYPGNEKDTLKNISFCLRTPNTYAMVGANGAGKTTIMKLLLGLYTNYSGNILINGKNLREHPELSQLFSVCFQDFAKYEINIRDNVLLGKQTGVTDEKIHEWIRLFDFNVNRFENGLDAEIGYLTQETTNLSLGEWQKLSFIRALAQGGSYYLLDEPTASLDPAVEATIYNDFMKIMQGKSALIITHRLGAARLADKVLVLDQGRIKEMGSHEELVQKQGLYYKMYESQKGWYEA